MAGAVGGVPEGVTITSIPDEREFVWPQPPAGTDSKPYVPPEIPDAIPDAAYQAYLDHRRQTGQPMSDYKAYADTTRGSAQHFGRVRGTDGEWLKGPDDRYIRQYPDPTELGQLDPGYIERHPSEEDLSRFEKTGSRAVYGGHMGLPIHGPAGKERYFTDWADVGVQYAARPRKRRPLPRNEDEYMRDKGFKFKKKLGTGGYGSVWLVKASKLFKDNQGVFYTKEIACKVMNIQYYQQLGFDLDKAVRKFVTEATVHSSLRHINIVECHHVYYTHDPKTGFPYIRCFMFMEKCNGDLNKLLGKQWLNFYHFNERQAYEMFLQVCTGLQYLHDENVSHMDLKIYNVLYVKKNKQLVYKLSDFGLSFRIPQGKFATLVGTIGTAMYMPPEMTQVPPVVWMTKSADIYSLGLILAESLSGVSKFDPFLKDIEWQNWTKKVGKKWGISQFCADLLCRMTNPDPDLRPTIEDVLDHLWFTHMERTSQK